MSETSNKPGVGELKTEAPIYDAGSKRFSQAMTFRAWDRIPGGKGAGQVTDLACEQFKLSLTLNGLDDYAWPPDEIDVHGHADGKGMVLKLATRADKRKALVLQ